MPRPSLSFRRVHSRSSYAPSGNANRVESLEARRLLSAAVDSVQQLDAAVFAESIGQLIQIDIATPIMGVIATPIIAIPETGVVDVTSPGEVFQPVITGPIATVPPIVADPIDQADDEKIKDKIDRKDEKDKDKSDKKEKKNKAGDALAMVDDQIDDVMTVDPIDDRWLGGGDVPLDLPPLSGGTDLGVGDGSAPDMPVIEIPDTSVPVIEVPIEAMPIVELPVTEVPPTVTPPIETPPTVTPPTDEPPTVTPPPSEPVVEPPVDDGTDTVVERPTDDPVKPDNPGGDENAGEVTPPVVRNPSTDTPVERDPIVRQPDGSTEPGENVAGKPDENVGSGVTPAPSKPDPAVAKDDSSGDVDQVGDSKSAADDFADRAAAAAAVFSSTPVTLDDNVPAPTNADATAGEAPVDAIEAVPAEEVSAATEDAQPSDESEDAKYGRVGAGGASEESRRVVRKFSVRVQTLAELAVTDPEQAQLAAATLGEQSVSVVMAEGEQAEEEMQPAAMASFSPASPTTTANVHNIMAAVLAGATFVTIYWNRWRKRKLEEAAAAASKLAGLLRFDPLAVWLDDHRPRHRR